jgi:hypothetical protein
MLKWKVKNPETGTIFQMEGEEVTCHLLRQALMIIVARNKLAEFQAWLLRGTGTIKVPLYQIIVQPGQARGVEKPVLDLHVIAGYFNHTGNVPVVQIPTGDVYPIVRD